MPSAINCREPAAAKSTGRRDAGGMLRCRAALAPAGRERPGQGKNFRMYIRRIAAFAALLLTQPFAANAEETDADAAATSYFERSCADKVERVAVYAPDSKSLSDITIGATGGTASWDRVRFEQLCARPVLYVYHCHTTADVLTRFPSGSK